MALDAGVVRMDVIHSRGIQDITARRMRDVLAARAVAALAAYVPLRHFFRVNVVVDRMAAVACRAGWPLHVVGRIERGPPVRAVGHEIRTPYLIRDVPLRGLRKIVVPHLGEV